MMERTLFALLLRSYPLEFRAEYGREMQSLYQQMSATTQARGQLWWRLVVDVVRSAPGQWVHVLRARSSARVATAPDYMSAACAGVAVFALYWLTLAPTAAFWDAGEYITVGRVLGIPHPPGNALFVLLARVWDMLLAPTGWPTAVRINVLSALASAAAHGFLYLCTHRMLAPRDAGWRRLAAACAVLMSATAFTVWNQSNVNEKVYTISFFTVVWTVWLALRWRDTGRTRLLLLAAYVTVLSMTNHLMGALVAPALLVFVWRVNRRVLFAPRLWAAVLPAVLLALSAQLFLPLRAAHQPLVNEADPSCASMGSAVTSIYTNGARGCDALSATLRREQYAKPSILTDPSQPGRPRDAALLGAQLLNYAQYLDWQWARSVAGSVPLFGGARPLITLLLLLVALSGARTQWRADRDGAALHMVLFATLSVGLVFYLNFRYGFTIQRDAQPGAEFHEVRERDYFFLISFSLFGAWIGIGIASLWHAATQWLARFGRHARLAAAPVLLVAAAPLALNWNWATRAHDWTARDWAYNVLMSVEPYGVLITNGDNDSFPLWYLQHVERVREDVTIVLSPYIGTDWYAKQIRTLSRPCSGNADPAADDTRVICQRPFRADEVEPALLAAWGGAPSTSPEDSILPVSDAEIARMAQTMFVTEQPLEVRFGDLSGHVAAGTFMTPVDTFVAAILQHTYGERPIHFMSPSPVIDKLGLAAHTVRVGLTWKLRERDDTDAFAYPANADVASLGSYIDLMTTDTLARDVFIVRGRINDPSLPWADHATLSIPLQYAVMHYAAGVAHELSGDAAAAQLHGDRLRFWNRVIGIIPRGA